MPGISKSSLSESDVSEIAYRISQDNPLAAFKFLGRLDKALIMLSKNPFPGQDRSDLEPGLRLFPLGKYLVLYHPCPDGIDLVRVLHAARDVSRFYQKSDA